MGTILNFILFYFILFFEIRIKITNFDLNSNIEDHQLMLEFSSQKISIIHIIP